MTYKFKTTVQQLIDALQKVENKELPIVGYSVGFTSMDSYRFELFDGDELLTIKEDFVEINVPGF